MLLYERVATGSIAVVTIAKRISPRVVLVVVFGALQDGLTTHGLEVAAYDWAGILDLAWKAAAAYLTKNFLSDEDGKVLGKIG